MGERLSLAVGNILKDEERQQQFLSMGMLTVGGTTAQMLDKIRNDTATLKTAAPSSGIMAQ